MPNRIGTVPFDAWTVPLSTRIQIGPLQAVQAVAATGTQWHAHILRSSSTLSANFPNTES